MFSQFYALESGPIGASGSSYIDNNILVPQLKTVGDTTSAVVVPPEVKVHFVFVSLIL